MHQAGRIALVFKMYAKEPQMFFSGAASYMGREGKRKTES
jgi:hypothetical protein